ASIDPPRPASYYARHDGLVTATGPPATPALTPQDKPYPHGGATCTPADRHDAIPAVIGLANPQLRSSDWDGKDDDLSMATRTHNHKDPPMPAHFHNPVATVFGGGSLDRIADLCEGKVALVTFPEAAQLGLIDRVRAQLGERL